MKSASPVSLGNSAGYVHGTHCIAARDPHILSYSMSICGRPKYLNQRNQSNFLVHRPRRIHASDPATRFLQDIIEDYANEWLSKMMFHYRWAVPENADHVAPLLVYWMMPQVAEGPANAFAASFAARQIGRLGVVGSNNATAATIEASYLRVLKLLDSIVASQPFLFGVRPSVADFAVFGQFTQLLTIEPTSAAIARENAPRLRAWIDHLEDATGNAADENGWLSREAAATILRPLLSEIGRTYVPYMQTNAATHAAGEKEVMVEIDGAP